MANIVEYILSLNSGQFNTGLATATEGVGALESALGSAKSMLGTLGVGFALFKGAEFVHDGVEAMHELEQSIAQVKAGLISTKGAAGLTFEDVENSAKSLAKALPYSRKEVLDMQAQLLTFPAITKESFGQASQAILDMSSRTHRGANELAIMLGKALQDPQHGITAMRRVGVNFNDEQTAMVKKMVETGHMAEAQKTILQELSLEFAGSAKAAADADPLFRYNKIMGSIKMEVGEAAMALLRDLTPALEKFANALKTGIHFVVEHETAIKNIALAFVGYKSAMMLAVPAIEAVGVAMGSAGAASMALLGPINLVAVAVAALTYAWWKLSNAAEDAENSMRSAIQSQEEEQLSGLRQTKKYLIEHGAAEEGLTQKIGEEYKKRNELALQAASEHYESLKQQKAVGLWDSSNESDMDKTQKEIISLQSAITASDRFIKYGDKKTPSTKALGGPTAKPDKSSTSQRVQGAKNVTINVSIKDFGAITLNTTNVKDSIGKIREHITGALQGAINDFQITANA